MCNYWGHLSDDGTHEYPTANGLSEKKENENINVSQINASFKTIQLLGQIIKNFHGKMVGETKEIIAETCFALAFRTISSFLTFVEQEQVEMLDFFKNRIKEDHPELLSSDIILKSNEELFNLSEFIVLAIIKHTSDSIGHPKLTTLFEKVFSNKTSLPHKVMDISIQLDHCPRFPLVTLKEMMKDKKMCFFSKTIIKHLVWLNLYLFPVKENIRQEVGTIIKIDGTDKILISNKRKFLPPGK